MSESQARLWLEEDPDPETRAELEALLGARDEAALAERFTGRLQFGTAGIRGILGAGPMRMNQVVVRRVSAGLATYLKEHVAGAADRGIVIGYDGRKNSRAFAEDAARVFLGFDLKVYLAGDLWATPLVAFAVSHLGAAGGVMVTASHNPPDYNGYKVYWDNGAQIIPPHDAGISAAIDQVDRTDRLPMPELAAGRAGGRLVTVGAEIEQAYLEGVTALGPHPEAARGCDLRIAYTPLHGVGARFVEAAFARAGFTALHTEPSQREPDGAFPTVAFPNPEEDGAMDRVLALATEVGAELVLANDPDADRLAVAIPDASGGYRMLTGDQIGVLLADYLLAEGPGGDRLVSTTVVSSQLLGRMAAACEVAYAETLTGFKWIANTAIDRKRESGARLVIGYEEALGYCVGELVRDKDGISAALVFAELAAWARSRGESIADRLVSIYRRHGLFLTQQVSLVLPGAEGLAAIAGHMARFRAEPPARIGPHRVTQVDDLAVPARPGAPTSDVLIFRLEGGRRVIMRPSGTEPKLKSYYEVREELGPGDEVEDALPRAQAQLAELREAHQALLRG